MTLAADPPCRDHRDTAGVAVVFFARWRTGGAIFGATGLAVLLLIVLLASPLAGCSGPEPWRLSGATMGTSYSIVVAAPPEGLSRERLAADIDAELRAVNRQMSTYRADSELSRFNRQTGADWFPVSAELVALVAEARRIGELSGGAFDVTVGPLVNLWGFGPGQHAGRDKPPAQAEIDAALARSGAASLSLQRAPPALAKSQPELYVDLSAIAKGHGVDRVAALLEEVGILDYLVEIGGELRSRGQSPRGDAWRLAVEKPTRGERAVQQVIAVGDAAVATSGDYRNYFERDGVRYSHTIDPRDGRPIRHALASVTVVQPRAARADALATALLVMGPRDGLALAQRLQLPAYFVIKGEAGFETAYSDAFKPLMIGED